MAATRGRHKEARMAKRLGYGIFSALLAVLLVGPASAQSAAPEATPPTATPPGAPSPGRSLDEVLSGVVRLKTFINPDATTTKNLGRDRQGSAIVIDDNGLVLTIGYLMVEAHSAELTTNDGRTVPADIVGYDHETGFGLLRAIAPLKVRPVQLGSAGNLAEGEPALVVSAGGRALAAPVEIASRRTFAGSWEYLVDRAIFTAPPHPAWSGAALLDKTGKLVGVGSLIVGDATGGSDKTPGNMFVPIDLLRPILGELMADGRAQGAPKPWLGMSTEESGGKLMVTNVTPQGPAAAAGISRGDVVVGVDGKSASGLADLYKKVWARGSAGTSIPLDIKRDDAEKRVDIKSMNRMDHLKLKSTF
jgi:S1-C subfamily serine protease